MRAFKNASTILCLFSIVTASIPVLAMLPWPIVLEATINNHHAYKGIILGSFSNDGTKVITASNDHSASVLDLTTSCVYTLRHSGVVNAAQFNLDSDRIVTASNDRTAAIWDVHGNRLSTLSGYDGHEDMVIVACFNSSSNYVLTIAYDETAKLWDANTGILVRTFVFEWAIPVGCFSPNGNHIAIASEKATKIFRTATGANIATLEGDVLTILYSHDGKRIVTASYNNIVKVWHALNGTLIYTLSDNELSSPKFSPDDRYIVTVGTAAKIWDAATGDIIHTFHEYANAMQSSFSPDSTRVAIGYSDNIVRVFDVVSGKSDYIIRHYDYPRCSNLRSNKIGIRDGFHSLSFSPDGKRILTVSRAKTAKVWLLPPEELLSAPTDATKKAYLELMHEYLNEINYMSASYDGFINFLKNNGLGKIPAGDVAIVEEVLFTKLNQSSQHYIRMLLPK